MDQPAGNEARRTIRVLLTAIVALPLVVLLLLIRHEPPPPQPTSQPQLWPRASSDAASEAWDCIWASVGVQTEDVACEAAQERGQRKFCRSQDGLNPLGDTWFMRHLRTFPRIPDDAHRHFVAAAISNDVQQRQTLLAPLTRHPLPLVQYRTHLEIARSLMRTHHTDRMDAALPAINAALAVSHAPSDEPVKSDAYFLLALYHQHRAQMFKALQWARQSIALDPCFYDARSYYVEWLLTAVSTTPRITRTHTACLEHIGELVDNLHWIGSELIDDRKLYIEMANRLAAQPQGHLVVHRLALGFVQYHAGDIAGARENLQDVMNARQGLPVMCLAMIQDKAAYLLEKIP